MSLKFFKSKKTHLEGLKKVVLDRSSLEAGLYDITVLCFNLPVHRKVAMNVRDQFEAVAQSKADLKNLSSVKNLLHTLCNQMKRYTTSSPLESYLAQENLATDILHTQNSLWSIVQTSPDEFLNEQILVLRESYEYDRRNDGAALRRLLRDCVQNENTFSDILALSSSSIAALADAVKLELNSSSTSVQERTIFVNFLTLVLTKNLPGNLSDFTEKIICIDDQPIGRGAVCLAYRGELYGRSVVIHAPTKTQRSVGLPSLKISPEWAKFEHSNVLPLLGICRNFKSAAIACVSPWMDNGTLGEYLHKNTNINHLKLVTDIAAGLDYLHSRNPPYPHTILSSSSVLVNAQGDAVVGGFAWAAYEFNGPKKATEMRWDESEEDLDYTLKDDIYQFGILAVEIMVNDQIRSGVLFMKVIDTFLSGKPLSDPSGKGIRHGLQGELLSLLRKCVDIEEHKRPSAATILATLRRLQEPSLFYIPELSSEVALVEDRYKIFACGGFGEIRQGFMASGELVALKTLSVKGVDPPKLKETKRFQREASIWNKLKHPNVLPFLGTVDLPDLPTSLVSPWMKNGNCVEYFKNFPNALTLPMIQGIVRGLAYLHGQEPPVIHGDLRAANVLVSDSGEALLADFGLAVIVEDLTRLPISTALQSSGNPRWMAYELLVGDSLVSKESDVWALGMVILELMSREIPFHELRSYPQVVLALSNGQRPSRPTEASFRGLTDNLWAFVQRCWSQDPKERPRSETAAQFIDELMKTGIS